MAQNPGKKLYHDHETNAEDIYKKYLSAEADQSTLNEITLYPVEKIHALSDTLRGNSLIDASIGPNISHLLPVSSAFKDITVLRNSTSSLKEMEKWMKNHPAAVNFSHVSGKVSDLKDNSGGAQEIEMQLRSVIKLLKCDFTKENIADPVVLEKADCVTCVWLLGSISTDKTCYMNNIRKLCSMLKPGGKLVIFGTFGSSFFCVGDEKFHILLYDENTVRKALTDAGCRILSFEIKESKIPDQTSDNTHIFCAVAVKGDV